MERIFEYVELVGFIAVLLNSIFNQMKDISFEATKIDYHAKRQLFKLV
jgi:hypothetical protein